MRWAWGGSELQSLCHPERRDWFGEANQLHSRRTPSSLRAERIWKGILTTLLSAWWELPTRQVEISTPEVPRLRFCFAFREARMAAASDFSCAGRVTNDATRKQTIRGQVGRICIGFGRTIRRMGQVLCGIGSDFVNACEWCSLETVPIFDAADW